MLQTEFFLPRVMSKITSSEGVVVPSPEIHTFIFVLRDVNISKPPVCPGHVLGVSPGEGHVLHVLGEGEVEVLVEGGQGGVGVVHQVLIPHADISGGNEDVSVSVEWRNSQ